MFISREYLGRQSLLFLCGASDNFHRKCQLSGLVAQAAIALFDSSNIHNQSGIPPACDSNAVTGVRQA